MQDGLMANALVKRMVRAARLDAALYDEVESDPAASRQALTIVLMAGVASGLGTLLGWSFEGRAGAGFGQFLGDVLSLLINWFVWSYVTFFVGTRVYDGKATPDELLRTLGFAMSPHVLSVLGFVPLLGGLFRTVIFFWVLVTGFIAVREALDLDNTRTLLTVGVGFLCMLVLFVLEWLMFALLGLPFRMLLAPGAGWLA